jgi:hypothetical protein
LLVFFWLFFFGVVTNKIAPRYGLAYLFVGPEYYDQLSWLSYFIVGFSCGGFIMAYNMASFIKNAFRFPFLATLQNPFLKYCINNFIFPLSFIFVYCGMIVKFLLAEQMISNIQIIFMCTCFLGGIAFFIFIAFTYFFRTTKDIYHLFGVIAEPEARAREMERSRTGNRNMQLIKESRDWYVETYLTSPFRLRLVRSVKHYKKEMLKDVIRQNQHSAFVFQLVSIAVLLSLGFFGETKVFEIPASASLFLLFTMFIMLFSSFYRWFRGWSSIVFLVVVLLYNFAHQFNISYENRAYGLNYDTTKAIYSYDNFKRIDVQTDQYSSDIENTLQILNKWKEKYRNPNLNKKPKLIFINTSGGGSRSTLWTFYTMRYIDSVSNGALMKNTQLITGSSGGMVGAAYLRELYLQKQQHKISNYYSASYLLNMTKDMLNPIAFKVATSEWLYPFQHFSVDNKSYPKDRAYSFENKLEENTSNVFNKRLGDYALPEYNSEIPMMIFAPSIVNDGRKLLISPQPISYLTQNTRTKKIGYNRLFDAIEYSRFFENQKASKTLFTSVLRMSATFPYISPVVSLPSEPRIEIMDAGLRDNYGLETTLRFIKTFNDWIAENTSGVVIIQIRDKHKNIPIEENPAQTFFGALSRPLGSFYSHLFEVQDYNQHQQIQVADSWTKSKIEIIDLQLRNEKTDRISLSWHLTNKEKKKVLASLYLPENQEAMKRIINLLK